MQREASRSAVQKVVFEHNSSQQVMTTIQGQLDDAGINITFNCHALANAMPEHAQIIPQKLFDIQVCLFC